MVNEKMIRALARSEVAARLADTPLAPALRELARSDVVELDGSFFLGPLVLASDAPTPSRVPETLYRRSARNTSMWAII